MRLSSLLIITRALIFFQIFQIQSAWAVLPVIDPAEIAQVVKEINQIKAQTDALHQEYSAITGTYQWGAWQNNLSDIKNQFEWAPSDWAGSLKEVKDLAGGNSGRYQELLKQYQDNHPVLSQEDYSKGSDPGLSSEYQNQVATTQVSAATVTGEFNDINQHLEKLQKLGTEIENNQKNNTLKSSVDLNSRIELEVAYISMEELRMQAILNQQTSEISATKISEESESAAFNAAQSDQSDQSDQPDQPKQSD